MCVLEMNEWGDEAVASAGLWFLHFLRVLCVAHFFHSLRAISQASIAGYQSNHSPLHRKQDVMVDGDDAVIAGAWLAIFPCHFPFSHFSSFFFIFHPFRSQRPIFAVPRGMMVRDGGNNVFLHGGMEDGLLLTCHSTSMDNFTCTLQ